jgi:hypothetical protein
MIVTYNKQKYTVRPGMEIEFDKRNIFGGSTEPNWHKAVIVDVLAHQFTAEYVDTEYGEQTIFRFYQDVGTTWRPIE